MTDTTKDTLHTAIKELKVYNPDASINDIMMFASGWNAHKASLIIPVVKRNTIVLKKGLIVTLKTTGAIVEITEVFEENFCNIYRIKGSFGIYTADDFGYCVEDPNATLVEYDAEVSETENTTE